MFSPRLNCLRSSEKSCLARVKFRAHLMPSPDVLACRICGEHRLEKCAFEQGPTLYSLLPSPSLPPRRLPRQPSHGRPNPNNSPISHAIEASHHIALLKSLRPISSLSYPTSILLINTSFDSSSQTTSSSACRNHNHGMS